MTVLYPHRIRAALHLITDPAAAARCPNLRAMAWGELMAARGKRVNTLRLHQMQQAAPALQMLTGLPPRRTPAFGIGGAA